MITTLVDRINERLLELVSTREGYDSNLFEAAHYAIESGGKRVRPIITMTTANCLGAQESLALDPACALELIHTYSLIHDDLPCMDNDDFRRGKPTLHRIYTEAHAILVGDFLLTLAFQAVSEAPFLSAQQRLTLVSILSKYSGGDGMIGGQVIDVNTAGTPLTLEVVDEIHLKKTGKLITAAALFGAIVADIDPTHRNTIEEACGKVGLAFQIVDDCLDVTASITKHGKEQSSDLTNHKSTYATLLGVDIAMERAKSLTNEATALLQKLPFDMSPLIELFSSMVYRKQ
jgi:geranylgeranyl diphosphate synthase type II